MSDKHLEAMHNQIEKVWGISCDHINADILHRYIDEQQDEINDLKMKIDAQAAAQGRRFGSGA